MRKIPRSAHETGFLNNKTGSYFKSSVTSNSSTSSTMKYFCLDDAVPCFEEQRLLDCRCVLSVTKSADLTGENVASISRFLPQNGSSRLLRNFGTQQTFIPHSHRRHRIGTFIRSIFIRISKKNYANVDLEINHVQ